MFGVAPYTFQFARIRGGARHFEVSGPSSRVAKRRMTPVADFDKVVRGFKMTALRPIAWGDTTTTERERHHHRWYVRKICN